MNRKINLSLIVFLLMLGKATAGNEKKDLSLPDSFYNGELKLTYSVFGKGASNAALLKKLHDSKQWVDLAKEVINQKSKGYDVYYFYLAKSAQMLGFNDSAKIYAESALKTDDKCNGVAFYDVCQGLEVDKEVYKLFSEMDLKSIAKEKYVPAREYLYPSPPTEVIDSEETDFAARSTAAAQKKVAAAEERSRARKDAIAALTKELKGAPRSFEVRGMNLGGDYYQDVSDSKGFASGKGSQVDGFPDTRKEVSTDGATLFFYRDILFMTVYDDLQDKFEIGAVMNQLESKFKSKFASIPQQKSRYGNFETTTAGLRMSIGNFGTAEVKITSTRPIDRRTCVNDIAREMRQRIDIGLRNYSSLTDRVEQDCKEKLNPTEIVFINKPIEAIVNSRANSERLKSARQAAEEKINAANEKAKRF